MQCHIQRRFNFCSLQRTSNGGIYRYHSHTGSNREDLTNTENEDARKWTPQHLEAADIPTGDLTPPHQIDLNADVNARGPGGYSKLAVFLHRASILTLQLLSNAVTLTIKLLGLVVDLGRVLLNIRQAN